MAADPFLRTRPGLMPYQDVAIKGTVGVAQSIDSLLAPCFMLESDRACQGSGEGVCIRA